jgi:hypothetical protein
MDPTGDGSDDETVGPPFGQARSLPHPVIVDDDTKEEPFRVVIAGGA